MSKKAFVFDWNGTLLPDTDANHTGFNATLELFDVPPVDLTRYRETMDFPLIHVYTRNGVHPDDYLRDFQAATNRFFETYRPLARTCPLQPGAIPLFEALKDQGYSLLILSNQNAEDLQQQIAERHITHYFDRISGNQDNSVLGYTMTNKLQRLEQIFAEDGYDAASSCIIGDSLEEPEIARHMGMTCFSVTWGCFSKSRLDAHAHGFVIDALAEVSEILQNRPLKEAI